MSLCFLASSSSCAFLRSISDALAFISFSVFSRRKATVSLPVERLRFGSLVEFSFSSAFRFFFGPQTFHGHLPHLFSLLSFYQVIFLTKAISVNFIRGIFFSNKIFKCILQLRPCGRNPICLSSFFIFRRILSLRRLYL